MGMIMKDGIPYGGIYPIDDAPTQGSNNAVKSGGAYSALSNKVDKIAGKGLSTNDYDDTEKEQNEANAEAIEAIVNVNGCCNVFAIDNPLSLSNVRVAYNGIVNTEIDPLDFFDFMFSAYVNGAYTPLAHEYISDDGNYSFTVSIPSNATKLQLKHNGTSRDLSIEIPTVQAGTYKLTFTVAGYNPSAIGGLKITNIMLYDARLNPTGYVSYAKTNKELTDEIETTSKKIAVKEEGLTVTPANAFNEGGNGMVLDIFNKEGQAVGHLAIRPKGFTHGYALELYYADWSGRAWDVPVILNREDSFNSADANNLYTIPLEGRGFYILSVNVKSPWNVFASNATNADTNYGKSVRLYNYDGTPYTGAAELKTIYISLPVS